MATFTSFLLITQCCFHLAIGQRILGQLYSCEERGLIKHINWDHLMNYTSNEIPELICKVNVNLAEYELIINCELEYLGYATDNLLLQGEQSLGITYVLGFESFDTSNNVINQPSTCSNRMSSTFQSVTDFNDYWSYSEYPYLHNHIGSNDQYFAYPTPSEFWRIQMSKRVDINACTPIKYHAVFGWNDLTNCQDANGKKLLTVEDTGNQIALSGTFYVNIVSPFEMGASDTGFYRVFPLLQQDFEMSVAKQINVLSSAGTDLFIISILSIFEDETDGSFKMVIFTQSADYILLTDASLLATPFDHATIRPITGLEQCVGSTQFTCGQLFEITVPASQFTTCPPADFRGRYELGFTVMCAECVSQAPCEAFVEENGGHSMALTVNSNFIDTSCDRQLYQSVLYGSILCCDDAEFTSKHDSSEPYVIAQDTIYVETLITFPDDNYDIFNVRIENIFVCTAEESVAPNLEIYLDQQKGYGGCLSEHVDADGLHHIITNRVANPLYDATIHDHHDGNILRFSFKAFNAARTTIFIHIQIMLELANTPQNQRRRLLSNDTVTSQIRHFMFGTQIQEQPFTQDDFVVGAQKSNSGHFILYLIYVLSFFSLLVV